MPLEAHRILMELCRLLTFRRGALIDMQRGGKVLEKSDRNETVDTYMMMVNSLVNRRLLILNSL